MSHEELEDRVRKLENWRAFVLGATACVTLVVVSAGSWLLTEIGRQRELLRMVAQKVGVSTPL